jgi:hypothetical protein
MTSYENLQNYPRTFIDMITATVTTRRINVITENTYLVCKRAS